MEYPIINPYEVGAKIMKVKILPVNCSKMVEDCPNFSRTGSIKGMKELYYGKGALLVRCGNYIYNVTSCPEIYYEQAN